MDVLKQLQEYQVTHQHKHNKIAHYISIPLILFATLIFLGWFHVGIPTILETHFAWLASLALVIYYGLFDWQLGGASALMFLVLNLLARFFSQPYPDLIGAVAFLICMVAGLIIMVVGHTFDEKKPTMKDWPQLLIAPLFLVTEIFFALGQKKDLQNKLSGK